MGQRERYARIWIKPKVILGFLLILSVAIAAVAIAYRGFLDLTQTHETLSGPNRKLIVINSILTDIHEAEGNIRSYSLTQDERHLRRYSRLNRAIELRVDTLLMMVADNPDQLPRVEGVKRLLESKAQLVGELVEIRRAEGQTAFYSLAIRELERLAADTLQPPSAITRSVVTTTSRQDTVVSLATPEPPQGLRNRLRRLFGGAPAPDTIVTQLLVEVETRTDTLHRADPAGDTLVMEVIRALAEIQAQQYQATHLLSSKELEILMSDRQIMDQIRAMVSFLEREELEASYARAEAARAVVSRSSYYILALGAVAALLMILFTLLIFRDIARSTYYQRRLMGAKALAEKLLRIKEEFLSNMSHEIRTPLSAIIGFAQQLRRTELTPKQSLFVDSLSTSGAHLLGIVNDILDLSKIEAGQLRFEAVPFSPTQVLGEVVSSLSVKAAEKGLALELIAGPELNQAVTGDPFRLKQILFNLVGNAIKFTERGRVTVRAQCLGSSGQALNLAIEVEDTGIGIAPDKLNLIFERFGQADSSITRSHGGTGLGLTIAKQLVALMGGTISVASSLGQGTTFRIALSYPLATAPTPPQPPLHTLRLPQGTSILVVDDDPLSRLVLNEMLRALGVTPSLCPNPSQALDLIRRHRPAVVLTDIQMPRVSGFDLLRLVRQEFASDYRPRVFALTANNMGDSPQRYSEAGFDGLLIKPFDEHALYQLLTRHTRAEPHAPPNPLPTSIASPLYSLHDVQRFANGNPQTLRLIIGTFIGNSRQNLLDLQRAVQGEQWGQVAEVAHRMKSAFRQFRAEHLAQALEELERSAGDAGACRRIAAGIGQDVDNLLSGLAAELAQVGDPLPEAKP